MSKIKKTISLVLDDEIVKEIKKLADAYGASNSTIVNIILTTYFKNQKELLNGRTEK